MRPEFAWAKNWRRWAEVNRCKVALVVSVEDAMSGSIRVFRMDDGPLQLGGLPVILSARMRRGMTLVLVQNA
jgi:hypothetical protein